MLKTLSIILDNSGSNQNADVVLFDVLKNCTHVTNPYNTYQTGANACIPIHSIEGIFQMTTQITKDYLTYFDQSGTLIFNLGKFIGIFKIGLKKGSYFQLLEYIKTTPINIHEVHVASLFPLEDEKWRIINTLENGETNEGSLTGTKVVSPQTVNNTIGIFKVGKTISKITQAVVKVKANDIKVYTIFYN